jgi:hypothetical protein
VADPMKAQTRGAILESVVDMEGDSYLYIADRIAFENIAYTKDKWL